MGKGSHRKRKRLAAIEHYENDSSNIATETQPSSSSSSIPPQSPPPKSFESPTAVSSKTTRDKQPPPTPTHFVTQRRHKERESKIPSSCCFSCCCDLYVPIPPFKKTLSRSQSQDNPGDDDDDDESRSSSPLVLRQILAHRLESIGYTHVAFTHVVYGAPHAERDRAEETLPLEPDQVSILQKQNKKNNHLKTLRRLHVVVETLSQVGLFAAASSSSAISNSTKSDNYYPKKGKQQQQQQPSQRQQQPPQPQKHILDDIFRGYDLISLAPGNEVTFQAVCATATLSEIITLDYTLAVPYRIRSADIRAAISRQAVFEIPYAPALLSSSSVGKIRKKLVQCCREFQKASAGLTPALIFGSGPRFHNNYHDPNNKKPDVQDMALKTPGDLKNLISTVLQFNDKVVSRVFSTHADLAISRGHLRRFQSPIRIRELGYATSDSKQQQEFRKSSSETLGGGGKDDPRKNQQSASSSKLGDISGTVNPTLGGRENRKEALLQDTTVSPEIPLEANPGEHMGLSHSNPKADDLLDENNLEDQVGDGFIAF